jgi:hypothetical protein
MVPASVALASAQPTAQVSSPAAAPAPTQTASRPQIVVQTPDKDAGIVGLGTDPVVDFLIENSGSAPLEIAVAPLPKGLKLVSVDRTIAPAGAGHLKVGIDTFKTTDSGEFTVVLTTNDPDKKSVSLKVKAEVHDFIVLTPATARFSFVQYEREGGTSHVLSATDDTPFELLSVVSPIDYIKVTSRELKDGERVADIPGRQWRIDLKILETATVGPIGGYIVVNTTHKLQPKVFLPVTGFVRPLLAVTPPALDFQSLTPPEKPDAPFVKLTVKSFAEADLDIPRVTSDLPWLKATVVPVVPGHAWRVELRLVPKALPSGDFAGTLRLETTHPKMREVTVKVQGQGQP